MSDSNFNVEKSKKKEFSDLFLIARKKICIVELLCGLHEKRTVLLLHFLVRVFNNWYKSWTLPQNHGCNFDTPTLQLYN